MNFDFSEEQKLLQKTARDYLDDNCPPAAVREILESSTPYSADLWKGVAEMGWLGTAIPEEYGGAGFGHLELAMMAEELGRALAPIPFSSSVYLASEALTVAGTEEQKARWLPRLAAGDAIGTLALVEGPGDPGKSGIATTLRDGRLDGTKGPVADGDVADLAIVVAREGDGVSLAIAELGDASEKRDTLESIDPSRSLASVTFTATPADRIGAAGEGWEIAQNVLDRAAVLMAFEQVGGAERAFEITREYALGRYAFGRPIASFQALKHRLADLWCAIELARSNAYYGAWALSNDSPELAVAACGARVSASKAFALAAEEMIQIHGGVGYTWEYDCHLFYRRAKLLELALGSTGHWRERLIQQLESAA